MNTTYCSIPVWLRLAIVWAWLLALSSVAGGQVVYKGDSSAKVFSYTVTTLGAATAAPCKIVLAVNTGAFFSKVGVPLQIALRYYADSSVYSTFELDSVSAISGDALTISKRSLSPNSQKRQWNPGTLVEIVSDNSVIISQLMSRINAVVALPSQTGDSGKFLMTNGSSTSWQTTPAGGGAVSSFNTRTGAVVPTTGDYSQAQISGTLGVTHGGTGITALAIGQMLYGSGTNTIAPLNLGSSLSISSATLNVSLSPFTTTNLAQGSNLYYTDSLARASISATSPLLYVASTAVLTIGQASALNSGYVTPTKFSYWDGKQDALTTPIPIVQGGSGQITRAAAFRALAPDTTGLPDSLVLSKKLTWIAVAGGSGGTGTATSVGVSAT